MEIFSQVSDPLPYENPESSLLSDASTAKRASHSDEEMLLATSRPKKRAGRRVFKETRHPIFRGVRRRNNNKWVCELREPNKKTRIWLGTYPTLEMAARAHDVAALALRGKSACLNFADSVWRLPVPASADAKDIRKAAAEAAESFRPKEYEEICEVEVRQEETAEDSNNDEYRGLKDELEEAKTSQGNTFTPENLSFMDEEVLFDMPGLLVNMAQGLLLSPPPVPFEDDTNWDDFESYGDLSLWSHSI